MKLEIIFQNASTPLVRDDVEAVYTKGSLLCVQLKDGLILKYPLVNVFSVAHRHQSHLGTIQKVKETRQP